MDARRSNRIVIWAIAFSLAAHAVVLYLGQHMSYTEAAPAPTPRPPIVITMIVPPTPPPPTPTPEPQRMPTVPTVEQPHAPPITPPRTSHEMSTGTDVELAASPAVGIPPGPEVYPSVDEPPATAQPPACSDPNRVAVAIDPVSPDMPEVATEEGLSGTTLVKVSLDAAGGITGVSVYQSSGSRALDGAAEAAARQTSYRPQMQDCEPVAGSYIFSANFAQQ